MMDENTMRRERLERLLDLQVQRREQFERLMDSQIQALQEVAKQIQMTLDLYREDAAVERIPPGSERGLLRIVKASGQ